MMDSTASMPKVSPILFRAPLITANHAGVKDTTRRIVTAANSSMRYGQFSGLELDWARAMREEGPPYLVAPCVYPRRQFRGGVKGDTQRRLVEVRPRVQLGELFWEKRGRFGRRAASVATYVVIEVDVARVQDMTDAEALREGVAYVEIPARLKGQLHAPRAVFAWLWDQINGTGSWAANPWVWIYRYRVFMENVDSMLERWEVRNEQGRRP